MRRLLVAFLSVILLASSALAIDQLDATTPVDSGLVSTYGASLRETRLKLNEVISALTLTGGAGAQYYLPYWNTTTTLGRLASKGTIGSILMSAGTAAPAAWTAYYFTGTGGQTYDLDSLVVGSNIDDNATAIQRTGGSATKVPSTNALMDLVGYAPTREIWIAPRTDGIAGDGTQDNPYDVSTSAKLHAIFGRLGVAGSYTTAGWATERGIVHFMPGTYHTDYGFMPMKRHQYIGAGIDKTTIIYDGNVTYDGTYAGAVFSNWGVADDNASYITISDMTLDANASGKSYDASCIGIRGKSHNTIERIRCINANGTDAETFPINIASTGSNNAIRDCVLDSATGTAVSGISISGANDYNSVIERNYVDSTAAVGITTWDTYGLIIRDNYINGSAYGINIDTGNTTNTAISGNSLITTNYGMVLGGGYVFSGFTVVDNYVNSAGEGIHLSGYVTGATFARNTITGATPFAFAGSGNANNSVINNIYDSGVTDLAASDAAVTHYQTVEGRLKAAAGNFDVLSDGNVTATLYKDTGGFRYYHVRGTPSDNSTIRWNGSGGYAEWTTP